MMGEYVKRSDALQAVGDIHPLDYNGQGIVERIQAIPAADVVEVVRCRDCVFGNMPCAMARYPSYFCADGKRKDGGQDE